MDSYKPLKLKIKLPTRVQPEVLPEPGEAGLYTNKIHYLRKYLLDELVTKKFAMDFMEPVDTAALQVPNYYSIIKRPMDVGTIIKRVQNRYYHRVDDLISDFRLVISNCFTFNRPGDVVYRNCQKLEKFFHRVLNKMPKGEEKPSTKDPRSSGRQHGYEKASEIVQRQCHEHLAKLQAAIAKEDDASISKYFNSKLDYLAQKVDRFYFKTIEEFRFEVTGIFKNFDNQIKAFHEIFHRTCDENTHQCFANCNWSHELDPNKRGAADSNIKLDKRDITEVLFALKRAESSVEHCLKSYSREKESRARGLIDAFDVTASRLKQKLMRGRKVDRTRDERRKEQKRYYNLLEQQSPSHESMSTQEEDSSDQEQSEPENSDESDEERYERQPERKQSKSEKDQSSPEEEQSSSDEEQSSPEEKQSSLSSDDENNYSHIHRAQIHLNDSQNIGNRYNFQQENKMDEEKPSVEANSSPKRSYASPQSNTEANNAAVAAANTVPINSTVWSDLQISSSDSSDVSDPSDSSNEE